MHHTFATDGKHYDARGLANVVGDEVADEFDVALLLALLHAGDDTGQVDERQVRHIGTTNLQTDIVRREPTLLVGEVVEVIDIEVMLRRVVRMKNCQLSTAKTIFYFVFVGDDRPKEHIPDGVARAAVLFHDKA